MSLRYVYSMQYDQPDIRLQAWVWTEYGQYIDAEIISADGATRTAQVRLHGHVDQRVHYHSIASVALMQGRVVLQAFGRPPAASTPEWVEYADGVAC